MNDKPSKVIASGFGLEAQQAELADRIARSTSADGMHDCVLPGVSLIRFSSPSQPLPTVYEPSLCVVVQGRKQSHLARETFTYDPLHYLVVSMSLPVMAQVIEATPERPYLCLRIGIDTALINELLVQVAPSRIPAPAGGRAMYIARTGAPLLDAVLRLVRLLDTPDEAAVLAPLALREIHYRVLTGELGHRLSALCEVDSHAQRIARAIDLLKRRYAEPLRIESLAEAAHMSSSSLHHRFKSATALSPLQYQKQLRLQEARRLMLLEGIDAAAAGHRVGYESASQFSREYRRLFGAPPRQDVEAARLGVRAAVRQ
ncbi:MAG: AraC family transcriptional regulator N-terminal domain-containing protein [Panacagrimonas sp.]